jgi:hypothetical protein
VRLLPARGSVRLGRAGGIGTTRGEHPVGTTNRSARSSASRTAADPVRPSTASHNGPHKRSKTAVRTRNSRRSAGSRSSTSEERKSMMCRSSPRTAVARAAGSREPRMVSAASLSPTAQPSVRSTRSSTASEPTSTDHRRDQPGGFRGAERRPAARISVAVGPGRSRKGPLIRGNPLERMTGIEPALSAWEAGEPTSQVVFSGSDVAVWGPWLVAFPEGRGPWGARAVDQDGHRPTPRRFQPPMATPVRQTTPWTIATQPGPNAASRVLRCAYAGWTVNLFSQCRVI